MLTDNSRLTQIVRTSKLFQAYGTLRRAGGLLTAAIPASVGDLCRIDIDRDESQLAEVIAVDGELVHLMPFTETGRVSSRTRVVALNRGLAVPCGDDVLGRILDGMGTPIDGKGPLANALSRRGTRRRAPPPLQRPPIQERLTTGIRAIDGMLTFGIGQRIGLFSGSGVGKSTLLGEIAKNCQSDRNVIALVGERGREVAPFVEDCLGKEGLERSVVIVTTSDQSPLMRVRSVRVATAIADQFRNQGHHVLFLLDSLTRMAMAQREIGLLLGEPPTSRGYTPSVFQLMATELEQLGNNGRGSVTAIVTVLVDGDDMNDPIADSVRSITDGHIVLSRKLAQAGHYPAVDIGDSLSRVFREVTDERHQQAARKVRQILAAYHSAEDLIQAGAYAAGSSPRIDKAIELLPDVNRFLQQDTAASYAFEQTRTQLEQIAARWPFGAEA